MHSVEPSEFESRRPPPRKGDILFRDDLPDWTSNARPNLLSGEDSFAYTEGYLRGARKLAEYVVEAQQDQDFLFFPIFFLYRRWF